MDRSYQYTNSNHQAYGQNAQYGQTGYPQGYSAAQQYGQAQYEATPPQIRNPFAPPVSSYSEQNATFDPNGEQQAAAWSAAYAPAEQLEKTKKGKGDRSENANYAPLGQRGAGAGAAPADGAAIGASDATATTTTTTTAAAADDPSKSNYTVRRKGGGETWEDRTLLEWDPTQFRIMVGNLAGEVTDDSLAKAFAAYGVAKARVVREKRTTKSKGYGFVSFTDGEQGFKAAREMVGKYIGSHPVTIQRSKTNITPIVHKDRRQQHHNQKSHRGKQGKFGGGGGQHEQKQQQQADPLKANTGAGVQKKPAAKPHLKLLG